MTARKPRLTIDGLKEALKAPNNCKVKEFRDSLAGEEQEVLDAAVAALKPQEFSAGQLRKWLITLGFSEDEVPGEDAFNNHKAGRKACKCHG